MYVSWPLALPPLAVAAADLDVRAFHTKKKITAIMATAATATPTPIPAWAPELNPELDSEAA
jgi:hypothetical protein